MSTINRKPFRVWNNVRQGFVTWQDRVNLRVELRSLSDRTLRDIGLSRGDECRGYGKPFWIP